VASSAGLLGGFLDLHLVCYLHEIAFTVESGLPMEGIGSSHLIGADEREEFPATLLAGRFIEVVILIQASLKTDLESLDEFIPPVEFPQIVVLSLQILEPAHDLVGETMITSGLELQKIRHLDFGSGDFH
jgi:hypothetical protein